MIPDLNADLGEGEPLARTRALMRWITSANVACGGHAGDLRTMEACVRLAQQNGVRLGAHPGPWCRADFGRGAVHLEVEEFELLVLHQVGALERVARAGGASLHHIKLHGALYHASETDEKLGRCYASLVRRYWPRAVIYARAGGRVAAVSRRAGVSVWEEAFVDRGYLDDGSLVPRAKPGAVLADANSALARVRQLLVQGRVTALSGRSIALRAQTLCIHADTPRAPRLAKAVAAHLNQWRAGRNPSE